MSGKKTPSRQTEFITSMTPVELGRVLANPVEVSRVIAGALSSDLAQHTLAVGRIVQAARNHSLLKQFGEELRSLREKGRLKEDCLERPSAQEALLDLLQLVDRDSPSEEKFVVVKALFLYSLKDNLNEHEIILAHELQRICSQLTAGELLVLRAAYGIHSGKLIKPYPGGMNLSTKHVIEWLQYVSFQIGHNDHFLVSLHEEKLVQMKLLDGRKFEDGSGISGQNFRLTSLGIKLGDYIYRGCEFIKEAT